MERMNLIDKTINFFSPAAGLRRLQHRNAQKLFEDGVRRYEGAGKGRRTESWKAPSSSAPFEIQRALVDLRNRSRDLVRNNPYAKNAVRKIANNVVGTGIIPTPSTGSKLQDKKIKQLWKAWAESTQCDYDGHFDFYGIQKLVMRSVAESGECIVRKRISKDPSLTIPLQLQVLEGDFIDTTKHGPISNGYIFYGIEFDNNGKIVAYWLFEQHPGGDPSFTFNLKSNRFPADEIIHVFEKERPGQFRGVPMGHAAMLSLKDLDEYEDAQLVRQKVAACFAGFITDANPQVGLDNDDDIVDRIEPGILETLPPGKSITFANPPTTEGYGEFTKNVLRRVAAGFGMDYSTLTGDLTAVNFSSGRMGWLEFNRNIQEWQWQMLVPMHCSKAWNWFTQMAAITGIVRANAMVAVSWSTPRREQINPEAETKAVIDQVQNKILPWSYAMLEAGYNPDEVLAQIKKDKEDFAAAGVPDPYTKQKDGSPGQQQQNTNTDQ